MSEPLPTLTLSELGRALTQGWRVLLGGVLTGIVTGVVLHLALPQSYSATASVQVEVTGVDPLAQTDPGPVDMATEETIAASRGIAGSRTVDVHAAGESSVLRISHTSGTPGAAAGGANAVARAYLADRSRRAGEDMRRLRAALTKQIEALPKTAPVSQVQPIAADLARARRLQVGGGTLIDAARPPERGNLPGLPVMCLAGAVLGLLGTMPLAALRVRPARGASRVVMLDVEPSATTELRQAASALADQVLVLREADASLPLAEQWCRHLRSVGIPATVVHANPRDA
jgi:uncharacterized protein involved in exopolysaccharide biosynthesis